MTKFKIVAVSDTVCPWCYVGKQKLDRAIRTYKELHPGSTDEFSTTWMPFYLNPDSPKTGTYRTACKPPPLYVRSTASSDT
jgi:predicted DsbA family dithiol-disulfide isomerase